MASFHFKGKSFLQNYHHTVKFHKLKASKTKGTNKKPSLDDNLLIHGDNLKALKALLPTHAGKVKCIYIDPPYNTGNEGWVYNDNVASPMIQQWLGKAVGIDDLSRHDKWCCMMYPRLVLLRELLAEDGAIFISIDDNEVHHLRMMLDEIFGMGNFLAQIVWQRKKETSSDSRGFATKAEYLLSYSKSEAFSVKKEPLSKEYIEKAYKYSEGNKRWRPVPITLDAGHQGGGYEYEITTPKGTKIKRHWRMPKKTFSELQSDGKIYFGKSKDGIPQRKHFLDDSTGLVPDNLWINFTTNKDGKKEIQEIFSSEAFETPKPTDLIKRIIQLTADKDSLILDSFAGSGTTAHAILALNQEDGGDRKFILVECEDYADKITAERIKRVIKGIPKSKNESLKKGLGGSFSYYQLGEELEMDKILDGKDLPSYEELARYAFFTSTGENWSQSKMKRDDYYLGSSSSFEVYLLYESSKQMLKNLALNLDFALQTQKQFPNRQKLIFAPACFMEEFHLKEYGIRFAQLPFEIYRMAE